MCLVTAAHVQRAVDAEMDVYACRRFLGHVTFPFRLGHRVVTVAGNCGHELVGIGAPLSGPSLRNVVAANMR